jgi:hypothetical protein
MYYKIRQPGDSFTPDQWMRTVIKELCVFSIAIWKQWNMELYGTDGAISTGQRRKETVTEAVVGSVPGYHCYPKQTVLCFIMLASMKFPSGLVRSIWMLISLLPV